MKRPASFAPGLIFCLAGCLSMEVLAATDPPIVFVSRDFAGMTSAANRLLPVEQARRGKLMLRNPDGSFTTLVDSENNIPRDVQPDSIPMDVSDPDVSFDGSLIVFAGLTKLAKIWKIFKIQADGTTFKQLTRDDLDLDLMRFGETGNLLSRYDDTDPCHLPDGRICFVSTRYPGIAPDGRLRTTNLFVVHQDGSGLERITSERFAGDTPTVDPATGKIIYSRWWMTAPGVRGSGSGEAVEPTPPGSPGYEQIPPETSGQTFLGGLELKRFPGVNNWMLSSINPDGTGLEMFAGMGLNRKLTQAYRPSFLESGQVLALFLPTTPFLGSPGRFGLRLMKPGSVSPQHLSGPSDFLSTPGVDPLLSGHDLLFHSAVSYPGLKILASGLSGAKNANREFLDYDIYLLGESGAPRSLFFGFPGTAELDAVPILARAAPPVIAPTATSRRDDNIPQTVEDAFAQGGKFTFLCENIFSNPGMNEPLPNSFLVGKRLFIEFYMNPQRTSAFAADPPLLIHREEIQPSGKIEVELPAGVPLFEVIKRSDDRIAVGGDGQIFHVGGSNFGTAGATARCVGCHAGHSMRPVPEDPAWTNLAPSAVLNTTSSLDPLSDPRDIRTSPTKKLVDRSTNSQNSRWAAQSGDPLPAITMRWSVPIHGRSLTLYGVEPDASLRRNLAVRAFRVSTFLEDDLQPPGSFKAQTQVTPGGVTVPLNAELRFDRLVIQIDPQDVSGTLENQLRVAALTEVEVEARVAADAVPAHLAVRGDVDCGGSIDITDPIFLFVHLFLGGRAPCCAAAADADGSQDLDITDGIYLLGFLFVGTQQPVAPFPSCGKIPDTGLNCDQNFCSR